LSITSGILVLALAVTGCSPTPATSDSTEGRRADPAPTPSVETVRVVSRQLNLEVPLPGELQPYEAVAIFPKVTGFVKWIGVDRGSRVRQGELLAELEAPEIASQKAEAQAKLQSVESQRIEAEAKLTADEGRSRRRLQRPIVPVPLRSATALRLRRPYFIQST